MKIRTGFVSNSSSSSFIVLINNKGVEHKHKSYCVLPDEVIDMAKVEKLNISKLKKLATVKCGIDTHKDNIKTLANKFCCLSCNDASNGHYKHGYRCSTHHSAEFGEITRYTDYLIELLILKDKIHQKYHSTFDRKMKGLYKCKDANILYKLCKKIAEWYYMKLLDSNNDSHVVCLTYGSGGDTSSREGAFIRDNAHYVFEYHNYIQFDNS